MSPSPLLTITQENYQPDSLTMELLQAGHAERPGSLTGNTSAAPTPGEGLAFLRWPSDNATVRWEKDYQQAQITN